MLINVSSHAIKQFHRKNFAKEVTDEDARDLLFTIAKHGKIVHKRPDRAVEIVHRYGAIAAKINHNSIVVITYLGDSQYQKWFRKVEIDPRYSAIA